MAAMTLQVAFGGQEADGKTHRVTFMRFKERGERWYWKTAADKWKAFYCADDVDTGGKKPRWNSVGHFELENDEHATETVRTVIEWAFAMKAI